MAGITISTKPTLKWNSSRGGFSQQRRWQVQAWWHLMPLGFAYVALCVTVNATFKLQAPFARYVSVLGLCRVMCVAFSINFAVSVCALDRLARWKLGWKLGNRQNRLQVHFRTGDALSHGLSFACSTFSEGDGVPILSWSFNALNLRHVRVALPCRRFALPLIFNVEQAGSAQISRSGGSRQLLFLQD